MAEALDPKELTNFRELVLSLIWSEEALVSILKKMDFLTRAEVLVRIEAPREAGAGGVHPTL